MQPVTFRFRVPIGFGRGHDTYLLFTKWFPEPNKHELKYSHDGSTVLVRFSEPAWLRTVEALRSGDLHRHLDVPAETILVEVTLPDVPDDVHRHIFWRPGNTDGVDKFDPIACESAQELVTAALHHALTAYNRLVSWTRAVAGQHWIEEYTGDADPSVLVHHLQCEARTNNGAWQTAAPYRAQMLRASRSEGHITEEHWESLERWFGTERRAPLVGQILANADELAAKGHGRAAIVEAVTALEVAISRYVRAPESGETWKHHFAGRVRVESLAAHADKVGLRGTLDYLLPVLLSEDALPSALLDSCRAAVDVRNQVVHQGQRSVAQDVLADALRGTRELCGRLATAH